MPFVSSPRQEDDWNNHDRFIRLALVNNMPDSVLADTESQFVELINAASEDIPVLVKLFSLPNIPRSGRARLRLEGSYHGLDDLFKNRFDAVIVTGTEPRQSDLRQEPYWQGLVDVLDWAAENTVSTVLSCLAAHAGVLHSEGIRRLPLGEKQFGVFDFQNSGEHLLSHGMAKILSCPHSRWNEVRANALTACGYVILTQSNDAGVDLFVKRKKKSLFVHFQGHPEYHSETLLKEYYRDAKRFLRRASDTYPSTPRSYFDLAAIQTLNQFRDRALTDRSDALMAEFPTDLLARGIRHEWHAPATQIYRNWFRYIFANKTWRGVIPGLSEALPIQAVRNGEAS